MTKRNFTMYLMKMLPNATSSSVEMTQAVNYSYSESYEMSTTFVEVMYDLEVIVFLQTDDQEIMQLATSSLLTSVDENSENMEIIMFPNPTTRTIRLGNVEKSHIVILI